MFPKKDKLAQQQAVVAMPLDDCLAKTYKPNGGESQAGRTVFNHCHIVGEVARAMMQRMPVWLREALFPEGSELVAAAHDIGKVSPTFQEKIHRGIYDYTRNSIPSLESANPDLENRWGGHGGVSQATAQAMNLGEHIPEILGQHHGYSPDLAGLVATDAVFGGISWENSRKSLVSELKLALNSKWPEINSALQARVLSGLTTVADWIGSNSWFEDPVKPWQPCIQQALDDAGFIQPVFRRGLSFFNIFGFAPHELQQKLYENIASPGVHVLEAPMGMGKTEAALYAAYIAMSTGKATGMYFALPTQLTSNKIHERVNNFLQKILEIDSPNAQALLLHSNAWLKRVDMGVDGQPGGSWFEAGKRGILAPFAVGTIDQALMAVMNVKHGFVRAFGLAGKVVILDEVHSYDAYTGTILDKLIGSLQELQCTVIILSATLTQQRRGTLLNGFASPSEKSGEQSYPLISAFSNKIGFREIFVDPLPNKVVKIKFAQHNDAINEALLRAEQGQQVLWIENTVDEAQVYFKLLAARAAGTNIECGLLHSRFLKADREKKETHWVNLYGAGGATVRQKHGRILVGTQVVEQSVDIDADFLVTRICPTDMLLQRLGRLWRHEKNIRPLLARREIWIISPALKDALENADQAFNNTAKVYNPYVLCRSLEVWEKRTSVSLPKDIPFLIDSTYKERSEVGLLLSYKEKLKKTRETLAQLAYVGLSSGVKTLPESHARTRYTEQDTTEVLLLRSWYYDERKTGIVITFLNGQEIYLPKNRKAKERLKTAALLLQNTVRVASHVAPSLLPAKSLDWLSDYLYIGDEAKGEDVLRVAKVQQSGEVIGVNGTPAHDRCYLFYDPELGYFFKAGSKD